MSRRLPATLIAALAVLACSKSGSGGSEPILVQMTASPQSATADGVNKITVTVLSGKAPISVMTSRGHFAGGATHASLTSVPGTLEVQSCDARQSASCAGPTTVTALADDLSVGRLTVTFLGFEDCTNHKDDNGDGLVDCADPQCPADMACSTTGLACGASGKCDVCAPPRGAASEPARETSCSDGEDNDCDGLIDCADPDCKGQSCKLATGATGVCTSGACACVATEAHETSCGDGVDNDCDGLVDCADPDCQPKGTSVGGVCNAALGLTCGAPVNGASACGTCPGGQVNESTCGDGKDNDCDGLVDCADPDCSGQACGASGMVCGTVSGAAACVCSGNGGPAEAHETSCGDGMDNDCDGLVDCRDPDCARQACGPNGVVCHATAKTCTACSGNGGPVEAHETSCGDHTDNDCDGAVDCADPDCAPQGAAVFGQACGTNGMKCDLASQCSCSGSGGVAQAAEASCGDGFDNDCDGKIDCADSDCGGKSCGPNGLLCDATAHTCSVCSGNGGTAEARETSCSDGFDNDCDGLVDCADPDCSGQACNASQPAYRCTAVASGSGKTTACIDPTTLCSVTVVPSRARIPADGSATAAITAKVTCSGAIVSGQTITFATSAGTITSTAVTDSAGVARATLTSTSSAGGAPASITARYTAPNGSAVTGTASVAMPKVGTIRLISPSFAVLGARFEGIQESAVLTFQVLGTDGLAYPDGLPVSFSHLSRGGSFIGPQAACSGAGPITCTAAGVTDATGHVTVPVTAGTTAALLTVTASSTIDGETVSTPAPNVAVVGAKAAGGHFSMSCTPELVAVSDNCLFAMSGQNVTCTMNLADRFGNLLGVSSEVALASEAGAAGHPTATAAYNPSSGAVQSGLGVTSNVIVVDGYGLPVDVAPVDGEQSYTGNADSCGRMTHNPRDGLVTVIAMTVGEEGFVDLNGNGVWDFTDSNGNGRFDPGETCEPFIDQGEPFVDANDSGVYEVGETFFDSNQNGIYDGPNGTWDADTVLFTETRIMYSGSPVAFDGAYSRWSPSIVTGLSVSIAPKSATYSATVVDRNFNPPATTFAVRAAVGNMTASLIVPPTTSRRMGLLVRQRFCAEVETAPGSGIWVPGSTCGNACTSAMTSCLALTDILNYENGAKGSAQITCRAAGTDTVTLTGGGLSLPISGTCDP